MKKLQLSQLANQQQALNRNESHGLASTGNINADLAVLKKQKLTGKKNIQPVLDRRNNRSRQNLNTANSRDNKYLNKDVFPPTNQSEQNARHSRNQSATALTHSQLGVRQFSNGFLAASDANQEKQEWSVGIKKLMAKVQGLKADGGGMSNVYLEHPAQFRKGGLTPSNLSNMAQKVIKKGKMQFQTRAASGLDARPIPDSYVVSPYEKQRRRHQPFSMLTTDQKRRVNQTQDLKLQGDTSQQFEYLVNKTFLQNENKELDKQASRISKLNALCQKVSQNINQLKNECRQGNFEVDPAFHMDNSSSQLKKAYGGKSGSTEEVKQSQTSQVMMTPLEAVTQGINLLYATGPVGTRSAKAGQANSHAQSEAEIVSYLPNINNQIQTDEDYLNGEHEFRQYQHQKHRRNLHRRRKISPSSASPETSPTTMSKSYFTRGPSDQATNMAVRRKRVQSAVNKRSRPVTHTIRESALSPVNINLNGPGEMQTDSQAMKQSRRTQSAIFRPLTNAAQSFSKLEHASNHLSLLKSSHPLFGLRPESSNAPGGQMSQEQMIQLLHQQIEKKLKEQPDALKSENDRKSILDNAIRQLFNKTETQTGEQQNQLDNLISKQKQTKLESISESHKRPDTDYRDKESVTQQPKQLRLQNSSVSENQLPNYAPVIKMQTQTQDSLKTDIEPEHEKQRNQLKVKGKTHTNLLSGRRKSTMITVQVTDVEADMQVPTMARHKSSLGPGQAKANKRNRSMKIVVGCDKSTQNKPPQNFKQNLSQSSSAEDATELQDEQEELTFDKRGVSEGNKQVGIMKFPKATYDRAQTKQVIVDHLVNDQNLSKAPHRSQTTNKKSDRNPILDQPVDGLGDKNKDLDYHLLQNKDAVVPDMKATQNLMFGGEGFDQDTFYDDEDYAFRDQRRARKENRKLTALSYDTAMRKSKVAGSEIQPILKELGRPPLKSPSRVMRMALKSSAQADEKLQEMYQNTIDEFKKKLYDKKENVSLARINEKVKNDDTKGKVKNDETKSKFKKPIKPSDQIKDNNLFKGRSQSPKRLTRKKSKSKSPGKAKARKLKKQEKADLGSGKSSSNSDFSRSARSKSNKTSQQLTVISDQSKNKRFVRRKSSAVSFNQTEKKPSETRPVSTSPAGTVQTEKLQDIKKLATQKFVQQSDSQKKLNLQKAKRRMTMQISNVTANSIQESFQDSNQPININITPSQQSSRMKFPPKKRTKKLMEIIKGYEEEKQTFHLSEEEKYLLLNVNQFEPKNLNNTAKNFGMNILKKFSPAFGGPQQSNSSNTSQSQITDSKRGVGDSSRLQKIDGKISLFGNLAKQQLKNQEAQVTNLPVLQLGKTQSLAIPGLSSGAINPYAVVQPTLSYQPEVKQDKLHLMANVSTKHKFYFDELNEWANITQTKVQETLQKEREMLGDFSESQDLKIDMHYKVNEQESCFVQHPDLDQLYELERGFKVNNTFSHGRNFIREDRPYDTKIHSLATSDPRLTRSQPDLLKFFGSSSSDEDTKFDLDEENKKDEFEIKPAMRVDDNWFKDAVSVKFRAKDDLDFSVANHNLQLIEPAKAHVDIENVKDVINKPVQDHQDYLSKILSTSQGQIANLYQRQCDFLVEQGVQEAKFEQRVDQLYGDNIIPHIENMGQIARSKLMTKEDVKLIEEEFERQDAKCPMPNGFINHIHDLQAVKFDPITEDLPLDCSVEIQRFGFSRAPVELKLVKIVENEIEAPVQLLWLLKMDDLLIDAISSLYYSPFRPAPILETFKMEFNVLFIDEFRTYLKGLRQNHTTHAYHEFEFQSAKVMPGMLKYFNNLALSRKDYQTHLAIRFSRPQMKRANRESMLNDGKLFKPDRFIKTQSDLQIFKRSKGMPEIVEARRDNALQLYVPHDLGSVTNHFHRGPLLADYRQNIEKILSDCISLSQSEDLCSIFTDEDTDSDDSEFDANVSVSSQHTSYLLLNRLKKGQSKSQVRQKRPRALRKFEAPISQQLNPIRIRISDQSKGQQAILLVQQDNEIMDLGRTPIRLHERFQHLWSHKIVVFEEPRDEQLGIHHEILPDGQSKDDLDNQDFCIFDAIEPVYSPQLVKDEQEKHNKMIEERIQLYRMSVEYNSPEKVSARNAKQEENLLQETLSVGQLQAQIDGDQDDRSSPSLLAADLEKPKMKKAKTKTKSKGKKKSTSKTRKTKFMSQPPKVSSSGERADSSDSSQLKLSCQRSSIGSRRSSINSAVSRGIGRAQSNNQRRSSSRNKHPLIKTSNTQLGQSQEFSKDEVNAFLTEKPVLSRYKSHI